MMTFKSMACPFFCMLLTSVMTWWRWKPMLVMSVMIWSSGTALTSSNTPVQRYNNVSYSRPSAMGCAS